MSLDMIIKFRGVTFVKKMGASVSIVRKIISIKINYLAELSYTLYNKQDRTFFQVNQQTLF